MRAFVTGGSGFVGRNLLALLAREGHAARALARSAAAAKTVQQAGAEVVLGDLDNEEALRRGMAGCDVVFHSAAKVEDWGDPADFERANVLGTERVLAAARAAGVPRLVHVSTEAVLVGAGAPRIANADETWPRARRPLGQYPRTKGRAEELVLAANGPGLATVIVRPRLIWGRGDTSVLPQIVASVRAGQFMWINGGRHQTSTCHVRNVCEGLLLAAERGRGGEIYFLTDGPPVRMREFMGALVRTQGVEPGAKSLPFRAAYALGWAAELAWRALPLRGQPPITRSVARLIGAEVTVDDSKARRELGYRGLVSREEGLRELAG